jgi:hypothetical protein
MQSAVESAEAKCKMQDGLIEGKKERGRLKFMKTLRFLVPLSLGVLLMGALPVQAHSSHRHHRHHHHHGYHHHRYHRPHSGVFFSFDLSPRVYHPASVPVTHHRMVVDVQRALNRRGYAAGPVDGVMGSRTHRAISAYQADHGLSVTGTINRPLLRSLGFL